MFEVKNPIPLILTAVASICATVFVLFSYGYLHIAKPEDALLLEEFTMLKTVPGQEYSLSLQPARQEAHCMDGILVLFDTGRVGLSGVLMDSKKRAVRCVFEAE